MKPVAYAKRELHHLGSGWDRFWFEPQHPASLGLLRIVAGGMLFYTHLVWGLGLEEFFGQAGWQDPLLVGTFQRGSTAHSFWWLVPADWLWPVHTACLTVLFCFAIGLWTRVTSLLSLAIAISYAHRAPLATFGLDQINGFLTLYLAIGPSGACYSIDRLLRRRRQAAGAIAAGSETWLRDEPPRSLARLATRLVQVHMCLLYLASGLAKLKGEAWWDGNAIWLGAANFEYQSGDLTWLAWHPWFGNFLTHATVFWESTFWIFVWQPKLRPWVLLSGVLMHLGIGAFLGMWTFGLVMIFTYVAFVPSEVLLKLSGWMFSQRAASVVEYSDGLVSRWLAAWRCAVHVGLPPVLLRSAFAREATTDPLVKSSQVPLSYAAWWRALRQTNIAHWPFLPAEASSTPLPRRIVVMSSRVALQINLEQRFRARGHYCRTAADVPGVCAALSSQAGQCLVLCVHQPEELDDVQALRQMCLAAGKLAPVTITAINKSLIAQVDWQATVEHRLIAPPFSCAELLEEIGIAWGHRATNPPAGRTDLSAPSGNGRSHVEQVPTTSTPPRRKRPTVKSARPQ